LSDNLERVGECMKSAEENIFSIGDGVGEHKLVLY